MTRRSLKRHHTKSHQKEKNNPNKESSVIKKILIANRGEIACRIIRTARQLKIKTVAIYSEIESSALHVTMADEAYCVGTAAPKQSYLNISKIIDILRLSHADAVHPGYGFLSENPEFAQAVEAAGAIFIGPTPKIIHDMGDKLRAKEIARAAGISLIPGSTQPVTTRQEVEDFTNQHGFPILLKAAAGGGGKGMRVVYEAEDIEQALIRTAGEALSSFNDDRVFIEKFIEHPRHIEVQILGDKHGTILHLGERDCSLQRRHQKVIEEAPASNLCTALRHQIIEEALKLARYIGYVSAGTVEFIVAPDQQFYFLEVNTRLQVEHPVTDWIYNLDLVEMMIQIAAGKPLSRTQETLIPKGHAIEARLYAEDADNDFLPSSGRLIQYYHPPPNDTLRIDAGAREGDNISIYYDPMIAKIIVRGCDRANALSLMDQYLSQFFVEGVDSNLNYLQRLLAEPEVVKGHLTTNLIADKAEKLSSSDGSFVMNEQFKEQLACIALSLKLTIDPFLSNVSEWQCSFGNDIVALTYLGRNQIRIKKSIFTTSFIWLHQQILFECQINEELIKGKVKVQNGQFYFTIGGYQLYVFIERSSVFELFKYLPTTNNDDNVHLIRSPMPGVLLSLSIAVGDIVKRGQVIAVIEAMKMENTLKSPTDGIIAEINAIPGESLIKSQIIARFDVNST